MHRIGGVQVHPLNPVHRDGRALVGWEGINPNPREGGVAPPTRPLRSATPFSAAVEDGAEPRGRERRQVHRRGEAHDGGGNRVGGDRREQDPVARVPGRVEQARDRPLAEDRLAVGARGPEVRPGLDDGRLGEGRRDLESRRRARGAGRRR